MSVLALLIIGVTGVASQLSVGRSLLGRHAKIIFILAVLVIFVLNALVTIGQYRIWLADPVASFLIPPHQSISYFAFYSFSRFFAPYVFSLVIALAFLKAALLFNKKKGGIFFEKEEPYLGALSVFLVGHPGWLIYLAVLILTYFMLHVSYFIRRREVARLPLYRLWVPVAFFVILLNEYWFGETSWWQLLTI